MEKMSIGFFILTCITVSVLTTFFAFAYVANGFPQMFVPQFSIAIIAQICLYMFRKTKSIIWPGNLMLLVIFLASWYRVQSFGGIQAPTFYTYTLIPVFSISFMPFLYAFFWTGAFVSLALVYHFLHINGLGPHFTMSETEASTLRIWGIFFANFSSLIWLYFFKKMTADYQHKLKELSQSRATLLRILSHDIANPLMVMDINLQRLATSAPHPSIDKVRRGSSMILNIIQGVREIEALLSGKKTFQKDFIAIPSIAAEMNFLFEPVLSKKSQILTIRIEPECANYSIVADRNILTHQVLANVMSNACKFSPANSTIQLNFFNKDEFIVIELVDLGIGIPEDIMENIFSFYAPTTRKGTENESGTGFGMPIARLCLQHMGGDIEISSDPRHAVGTTVRLYFQKSKAEPLP